MRGPLIAGTLLAFILPVLSQNILDVVCRPPRLALQFCLSRSLTMKPSGKQRGIRAASSPTSA